MGTPTVYGYTGMTQVSEQVEWTAVDGNEWTLTFEGPIPAAEAVFLAQQAVPGVSNVRMEKVGGMARIYVQKTDITTAIVDNVLWEVMSQDIYFDLRTYRHRFILDGAAYDAGNDAAYTFCLDADQTEILKAWEECQKGNSLYVPAANPALRFHKILRRGTEQYVRALIVLQQVVRLARNSTVSASWKGVDMAWKLSGELGSPTAPSAIIGLISEHPIYDATKRQWLKRGPNVREISDGKYEIVYQWWFARRWSEALYAGDAEDGNP